MPRVLEVLGANHRQTRRGLLTALSEAVEAHASDAEMIDDLTIVVIK